MPNVDSPSGLVPYGNPNCPMWLRITADYATALYIGTPVIGVAGGTIEIATAGTGNPVMGACIGFRTVSGTSNLEQPYYPASSADAWEALVTVDPLQKYVIQEDNDTTDVALSDCWNSANLVATSAGSAYTGLSGWELNSSDAAGAFAAGDQLRIWEILDDNVVGNYAKWIVTINNHFLMPGIVGVGV